MQDIRALIEQTEVESESGNSFKSYIWVLMVDNYANTKYAAEQTGKKEFTSTINSLSILAFPTKKHFITERMCQVNPRAQVIMYSTGQPGERAKHYLKRFY